MVSLKHFSQSPIILKEKTSHELDRVPHCSYSMAIKAKYGEKGETPWTDQQYFGKVIFCFVSFF